MTVVWFELYTRDLARASAFYTALLGWAFTPFEEYDPERYLLIRAADGTSAKGALVHRDATPEISGGDAGSGTVVYVEVADLDAALGRAAELGGSVVAGRRRIGPVDGFFALVADVDGNVLGLWAAR